MRQSLDLHMKYSEKKKIEINILDPTLGIYANPMLLLLNKKIKRAEAGQWFQEIQKLLNGFLKSIDSFELFLNKAFLKQPIKIEDNEIQLSESQIYENITYMLDNALLRLFACLDKTAHLVRVYLEHPPHGGPLNTKVCWKCSHPECKNIEMSVGNCNFTSLYSYLKGNPRDFSIVHDFIHLFEDESIIELRPFRNGIAHRENILDQSVGIAPMVAVKQDKINDTITGEFTFPTVPEYNWFRVELAKAYNSIINFLNNNSEIIFPKDIQININEKTI